MTLVFRNVKGSKLTIADMDGNFSHLVAVDSAETSRATAAEAVLTSNLNSEISTRATADATLTNNLNTEIARATAAEDSNGSSIRAEIIRATAAETANTTAITNEATTARAAETANATAITNEASTARAAETANANAITAEAATARAAETANANNIAAEITRATNAEDANAAAINALPDSAQVLGLIDSSYIQARQITYDFLDSSEAIALIDSSYIQLRDTPQDFAYSSLTGAPTIPTFGTNFIDSATSTSLAFGAISSTYIQNIVDSDYVQAREAASSNQNAFSIISSVGQSNVSAGLPTDTLTLVAGSNVTITTNASGKSVQLDATFTETITLTQLKNEVAASADFAAFKARIAAL